MIKSIKANSLFIIMLIAIFYPTSVNSNVQLLNVYASIYLPILFIVAVYLSNGEIKINIKKLFFLFGILGSLLFYTITSPLIEKELSVFFYYLSFSLVILMSYQSYTIEIKKSIKVFRLFTLVINFLGVSMVNDLFGINDLMINYYSYYYNELLGLMIAGRKPVLTFATHSVAGLAIFLILFMMIKTYSKTGKVFDLLQASCLLFLLYNLKSFTGIAFTIMGTILIMYYFKKKDSWLLFIILLYLLINYIMVEDSIIKNFSERFELIFSKNKNGFKGRYSEGAALNTIIEYISSNEFRPVGLGTRYDIATSRDSGYIEYYFRGGVILLVSMIGSLISCMKNNLKNNLDIIVIIGTILVFETGFTGLLTLRIIFMLPFLMVYLRSLENVEYKNRESV